jgi:hypothetical protein
MKTVERPFASRSWRCPQRAKIPGRKPRRPTPRIRRRPRPRITRANPGRPRARARHNSRREEPASTHASRGEGARSPSVTGPLVASRQPTASMADEVSASGGSRAPGSSATDPSSPPVTRTRLQKGIHQPKQYTDGTIRYSFLCATGEPRDLNEALDNKN